MSIHETVNPQSSKQLLFGVDSGESALSDFEFIWKNVTFLPIGFRAESTEISKVLELTRK